LPVPVYSPRVLLPQQVGDYELIDRLGAGGFGTVYRARIRGELGFSQEVAVKLVADEQVEDRPGVLTALADEAHFLSRIAHPHIVSVRRFSRVQHEFLGGVHVLEMELVRGMPLGSLLRRVRRAGLLLPVESTLSLLVEGADALRYAHGLRDGEGRPAGLVHRDLKPDNLLVSDDGRLKVLDFGIAWAADRMATNTETGVAKGTLLYMSPEQARGRKVDGRSDLFSLGAIAFELLTGEMYVPLPEGGRDVPQLIWAMSRTDWADRRERAAAALRAPKPAGHGLIAEPAEQLLAILDGLLPVDPDDRFPDAQRLLTKVERLATRWNLPLGRRYLRTACTVPTGAAPELASGDDVELETDSQQHDLDVWTRTLVASDAGPFPPTGVPARPLPLDATRPAPPSPRRSPIAAWIAAAVLFVALGAWLLRPDPPPEGADATPVAEADASPAIPEPSPSEEAPTDEVPEPSPSADARAAESDPAIAAAVETIEAEPPEPTPPPEPAEVWPTLAADPAPTLFPGTPTTLSVRVRGGTVRCTPELYLSPKGARRYRRHALKQDGDQWAARVDVPYGEEFQEGAEYFFQCCRDGSCRAAAGSRDAPLVAAAADL